MVSNTEIEFNLDQESLIENFPAIEEENRQTNSEANIRTELKEWQARV